MERTTGLIDVTEEFGEAAKALHIAYYIPVNWGIQDRISRSVVDFQHARDPQAMQWIRLTALLAGQVLSCDVIVRALSSRETAAGGALPLDKVCQELARRINVAYAPERLWKNRQTQAVKNAGGRATRIKLLLDAYRFDAVGLSETPRVLIVDDVITTGATLSAVASAIRKASPAAEIQFLALARTEPHLALSHLEHVLTPVPEITIDLQKVNAHLDERYFFGTTSPVAFRPRPVPLSPRPSPSATRPAPAPPVVIRMEPVVPRAMPEIGPIAKQPTATFDETPESGKESHGSPAPTAAAGETRVDERTGAEHVAPARARLRSFGPVAAALAIAAVLFVAFLLLNPPGEAPAPEPEQKTVQEGAPARNTLAPSSAKPDVQLPQVPKGPPRPRMEIAVPSVGLRSNPGFDAAPLSINLTEGEKVTILDTYVAVSGPSWVRVRTKSGKTGWVFAGGVRVDTAKSAAKVKSP